MKSFNELKKNLKKDNSKYNKVRIAILGDFSTQLLGQALKAYGHEIRLNFNIFEPDYDQIDLQINDPSSELFKFSPDFVVIFPTTKKLLSKYRKLHLNMREKFSTTYLDYIKTLLQTLMLRYTGKIIFSNFFEIDDGVFGNYSNKLEYSFLFQLRKINYELMLLSRNNASLYINDVLLQFTKSNRIKLLPEKLNVNSSLVFDIDSFPVLAKNITDIVCSILGKINKCIIFDLDNTLWGGVIGDDGIENIQIGDLGIGKSYSELQMWAKSLSERGIVLAVCSKNDEVVAKSVFEEHPEMVLRLEDIAVFVANWQNKVDNLCYIQKVLNIGFDSMVFIDDNPFEREMVRSSIPDITVPELPEDPTEYHSYLVSLNLFETASISSEDKERTVLYQQEAKRVEVQNQYIDELKFLSSLDMRAEVLPVAPYLFPRIAQLTQRSNQFNLRTIRYNESDIESMANNPNFKILALNLRDQFGEYGLISVIILEKQDSKYFIDTWIMSCRVLKRGVEEFMMNKMIEVSKSLNIGTICGEYIQTMKNALVKDLLPKFGFIEECGYWKMEVGAYQPLLTSINKV